MWCKKNKQKQNILKLSLNIIQQTHLLFLWNLENVKILKQL